MEWFFWYLFGFAMGGAVIYLLRSLTEKQISLRWYEWILGALTVLLFTFMVETFVHSLAEMQVKAAWLSLAFIGLPLVILAVVTVRSVQARSS